MNKEYIDNNKALAIIGNAGTGKTNLAIYLRSLMPNREAYILGYPKDLADVGIKRLSSIQEISKLPPCVLLIDEFGRYFPHYDRRSNESLMQMLRFCEHKKIKLILTTQTTQDITRSCEAFIPQWAIKQISMFNLKNGSKPSFILKYAIKDYRINKDFMDIGTDSFVWFNEQSTAGENGVYSFPNMNIGKDWAGENSDRNSDKKSDGLGEAIAENKRQVLDAKASSYIAKLHKKQEKEFIKSDKFDRHAVGKDISSEEFLEIERSIL